MSSVVLLGGIPTHKDLAPSIVFVVLYALAIPLYIWRQHRAHSRSLMLIRPGIFIIARLAVFILRAIMAKGNYGIGFFIAELILLTIGFVLLIDPLIGAWGSLVFPSTAAARAAAAGEHDTKPRRSRLNRAETAMRLVIVTIIASGSAIGGLSSPAMDDPDGGAAKAMKALRIVNYVLAIVLVAVLALGTALSYVRLPAFVPAIKAAHIIGTASLLLIPCAYKLAQNEDHAASDWVHSTSAFFVLLVLFEYLALLSLLAVPWAEWYPSQKAQKRMLAGQHETTLVERPLNGKPYSPA